MSLSSISKSVLQTKHDSLVNDLKGVNNQISVNKSQLDIIQSKIDTLKAQKDIIQANIQDINTDLA